MHTERTVIYAALIMFLTMNIAVWIFARDMQARWTNVPPVPSKKTASFSTLGDNQLAYRTAGLILQNLGGHRRP